MIVIFGSIIVFITGVINILIGHNRDNDFWIFVGIIFIAISLIFMMFGGYMWGRETEMLIHK